MKTAYRWAREWLFRSPKDDGDIEVLAVAIEARDREVRAAALREAADEVCGMGCERHCLSHFKKLLDMAERAERGQ